MNNKIVLILFVLIGLATSASAQRRPRTSPPSPESVTAKSLTAKPPTARLMVQGTYEETFQGTTSDGNAEGSLVVKFEAARWLKMETNEAGKAEFSDWDDAPAPDLSGTVSYHGLVKGGSGGESYNADSNFSAQLSEDDIVLTIPEYSDTGDGLTMSVIIQPTLKGKCSTIAMRNGKTTTSNGCDNGTFFITATSPLEIEANDDPAKNADTPNLATFEIEVIVEPEIKAVGNTETTSSGSGQASGSGQSSGSTQSPGTAPPPGTAPSPDTAPSAGNATQSAAAAGQSAAGDSGAHAWRGAVTNGTKEAGFKITLTKTKELPSIDRRGKIIRKLNFTATIVPGSPK